MKTDYSDNTVKRSFLLPVFIVMLTAIPAISTDMVLPAIPGLAVIFDAPESVVNLTIMLFFLFFAVSILISGAVSDKLGRKPTMLAGLALYCAAGVACIFSRSIEFLVMARIFQALGAGVPMSISMAVIQDLYSGEEKKRILAVVSSMVMIAPAVAPIIGSLILTVAGWKMIFVILTAIGVLVLIGCTFFTESIPRKNSEPVMRSLGNIFRVMKIRPFRRKVFTFALSFTVVLGFVGGSSLIFISDFGVSEHLFSILFSVNALFSIVGSLVYPPISRVWKMKTVVLIFFSAILVSGVLNIVLGSTGPLLFLAFVIPATFAGALLRPLGTHVLMDQGGPDFGAASSMLNFLFILFGSIGMQVVSFSWDNRVLVFGIMTVAVGLISLATAPLIYRDRDSE